MRIVFMLLGLVLLNVQAFAGKIVGKVSDEKTGEALIGATVIVKGTNSGTATDVDGNFNLTVEAGTHTLEVKYIGYQTKEIIEVVVKENEITTVNIIISEASSTQLNEVVVRSSLKKENISALYTMVKNSVSVSSGISADLIQRSPDRNTGEVLKRVSGASIQNNKFVIIRGLSDRYNTAMINGAQMASTEPDRKAFSFDIIPSNLIDNIIINKTASADLPGDFAGGVVQVTTKDVPDANFLNIGLSLGYNSEATFKDVYAAKRSTGEYLGFSNNSNELPSAFGKDYTSYKGLPRDQQFEAARQLENNFKQEKKSALPNMSLQLTGANVKRFGNGAKLGSVVGVSYRNGYNDVPSYDRRVAEDNADQGTATNEHWSKFSSSSAVLANFSYVKDRSKISLRNLLNTLHDDINYARTGYSYGSSNFITLYSTVPNDRRILNNQLEGDHAIGKRNIKLNWNINYTNLTARQQNLRSVAFTQTSVMDENNMPVPDASQPAQVNDRNSRRLFSTLKDNSYGANTSLAIPFELWGQNQSLKIGYAGVLKQRDFNARIFQYKPGFTSNHSGLLTYDQVFATTNINENGFELDEITNPTDAYKASSLLSAGYFLLDNALSEKWRLTWGVRYESYNQNLDAVNMSGTKIDKTDVFNDILPSLNLSYSPGDRTKIRFSASRTVNRPEFREIAPFQFLDIENNWTLIGNPDLKRANITNLDLRYEFYPAPGETITLGAFFKHFENPIENKMNDQSNLDLLIFGYQNAPSARAFGAELDIRKNLSFISDAKWLENLTIGTNLTYVNSKVDVDSFGINEARPLQGQSPYLVNFSLLYNDPKTGLGLSALYNRVGERIYIVGSRDIRTTWERARDVIDLQVSKSLFKKKAELKFTVSDVLNQPYLFYWNYDGNTKYNKSTDVAFQKYKYGTTFTLGFNYKIGR